MSIDMRDYFLNFESRNRVGMSDWVRRFQEDRIKYYIDILSNKNEHLRHIFIYIKDTCLSKIIELMDTHENILDYNIKNNKIEKEILELDKIDLYSNQRSKGYKLMKRNKLLKEKDDCEKIIKNNQIIMDDIIKRFTLKYEDEKKRTIRKLKKEFREIDVQNNKLKLFFYDDIRNIIMDYII